MKWSWPALKATGVVHTVDTPGGRRAGFLVRSTSGVELGLIWQAGNAWMWRTPDGKHHGERSSQTAAVRVLRDAHDLPRVPRLPFDAPLIDKLADCDNAPPLRSAREMIDGWSIPKAGGKTGSRPKPALKPRVMPTETTPPKDDDVGPRIKWGVQTPDLTAAIAAALAKRRDGG